MASIRERNGKFNVIYSYTNEKGERKQKWETYETKAEAKRRKKEIEYKKEMGSFVVRKCKTLDELITEYVALYGKENWALSTYEGNVSLINNYILPIIGDTDVYSHILDDDRRKNAELFEEAFYEKKNLDPQMHVQQENNNATVADEVDPELLAKVLANPEMRALLNSLAKTMK